VRRGTAPDDADARAERRGGGSLHGSAYEVLLGFTAAAAAAAVSRLKGAPTPSEI
jgi:hypothetical protein